MAARPTPSTPARRPCYRACDRRYPFLWATADQPPGRWHDAGEGPCHYLATTAKGAWAEILRHEEITQAADVLDVDLSLWSIDTSQRLTQPALPQPILTGDRSSYPRCRLEARRLRAAGEAGLVAPSAAVHSGHAEQYEVDAQGTAITGSVRTQTVVIFGSPLGLVGMPAAEGHPDPTILADVRHF